MPWPDPIVFQLPWPPSVNDYYTRTKFGGLAVKKRGKNYREITAQTLMLAGWPESVGKVRVQLQLHAPDNRRRDSDNIKKCLFDALTKAGLYSDDSLIDDDHTRWGDEIIPGGVVIVRVTPALPRPSINRPFWEDE